MKELPLRWRERAANCPDLWVEMPTTLWSSRVLESAMNSEDFTVQHVRKRVRALWRTALIVAAVCSWSPAVSFAEEPDQESQEQRIKKLEAQVEQLLAEREKDKKKEQQQAQKDQEPKAQPKPEDEDEELAEELEKEIRGMTPEQLEKWKRGIAAGQPANYDAAWHIGTPQRDVVDRGWWGVKGNPSEFRISGWVQVALFHDFQGNALPDAQEFSAGAVIVPTLKQSSTGFDAASSRLFVEFRNVFKGKQKRKNYPGVTHVLMEMDLGGGRSGTDFIPRVRQLWVQHGHITFGQSFSTFANGATWPAYFDRGAPGAFPLLRKPVLRYAAALSKGEKDATHVLTPGIEESDAAFTNATSASNAPDMVLRYDYSPQWGNLMGAVLVRYLIAQSTLTPARSTAWVAAGTLSGWATIPTKNEDRFKWNFVIGPGTTMWDTAIGGVPDGTYVDATNTISTTNKWGIWAGWERHWAEQWNSLFMLSYADVVDLAGQPTTALNNAITATGTLGYEPWNHLFVAVEYFYGRRANFNSQIGQDHRLNLVLRYMINR